MRLRNGPGRVWIGLICLVFLVAGCGGKGAGSGGGATAAADCLRAPFDVDSYYGPYDISTKKPGHPATSHTGPKREKWERPARANQPYVIGVAFPHLKDPYWLAVNYGVVAEARCLGVGIELVAAKGYDDLTGQINQVEELVNKGVDGIILAGISYAGEDQLVAKVSEKIPVVEVINDIQAPAIAGKALVSFYVMGYEAGRFVAQDSAGKEKVKVGFLPGPAGSGWAPDTVDGFTAAINEHAAGRIEIVDVQWGDTGKEVQRSLAENMVNAHPDLDYIVGTASGVDAATEVVAPLQHKPKIVGTHLNPPVWDKIKEGKIAAGSSDWTALQGRMAVDMMVRLLNGEKAGTDFPFRTGPVITIVTTENVNSLSHDDTFGPYGFQPVFKVEAKK